MLVLNRVVSDCLFKIFLLRRRKMIIALVECKFYGVFFLIRILLAGLIIYFLT